MSRRAFVLFSLFSWSLLAEGSHPWTLAKNEHFEVFSQSGGRSTAEALRWFEQMRAFFAQDGLHLANFDDRTKPPLRIVGFQSEAEYSKYRLRAFADAYYASDGGRDYVVLASLAPSQYGTAAHEYAHYIFHASNLKLPVCLQEGLAELFSTLRPTNGGYYLGGDLPARLDTLQLNRKRWIPVDSLFATVDEALTAHGRKQAELFYAESWALADLLVTSAKYGPRFHDFVSALDRGTGGAAALETVYGVSFAELGKDLMGWMSGAHRAFFRPWTPPSIALVPTFDLSESHEQFLWAQLSLVSGRIEEAKRRFDELAATQPNNPDLAVALGTIALREGDKGEGLRYWRRAIELNTDDPELCYRYSLLADDAGLDTKEIEPGYERAIQLVPGFDDARYRLALLEYRDGEYRASLENLKKTPLPADPGRVYAYWTARAACSIELKANEEARQEAVEAVNAARSESDRERALQLVYTATTDVNVQLETDANGHSRLVTVRVPHGAKNWNPFIEPSDVIQHSNGRLTQVICAEGRVTGFLLQTAKGAMTLNVADPSKVLMRNSPEEFYCGPMRAPAVEADYAIVKSPDGEVKRLLRGMTFPAQ